MKYPIGFSIPEEKIIECVKTKKKLLASLIPGDQTTYVFSNEEDYYKEYQESIFALTYKKGGYDCMRHYEILANGCIPWFIGLKDVPSNRLTQFPKAIVLEAMSILGENAILDNLIEKHIEESKKLYGFVDSTERMNKLLEVSLDNPLIEKYSSLLLDYTRKNLTTEAMARYMLSVSGNVNAKSVLYLSKDISPDYQRCVTLHGFKKLLGKECHDFPCIPHLYTDFGKENAKNLYGKGISYTCLLKKEQYRNNEYDSIIEDSIRNRKYDLIVYGSIHRGMILWELVNTYYKPNEILLVCGEDHNSNYGTPCEYIDENFPHPIFIREL
jgi:hypothetical protein